MEQLPPKLARPSMEAGPPRLFRVFLSAYCLGARSLGRFSGFSHQPVGEAEIRYSDWVKTQKSGGRKWEVRFALKSRHGQPGPSGLKSADTVEKSATPDSATSPWRQPLIMIRDGGDPNTAMALKPYPE